MGLEDKIDVTDDIGCADVILASSHEMKQNPWIRGVAKFHELPVFVIKVSQHVFFNPTKNICSGFVRPFVTCFSLVQSTTMAQMVKAVRLILEMDSYSSQQKQSSTTSSDIEIEDDAPKRKPSLEEIDALEVRISLFLTSYNRSTLTMKIV